MFRSCQIIIRELCSLLKLYYSIHNSIRICKRGVLAAYHVVLWSSGEVCVVCWVIRNWLWDGWKEICCIRKFIEGVDCCSVISIPVVKIVHYIGSSFVSLLFPVCIGFVWLIRCHGYFYLARIFWLLRFHVLVNWCASYTTHT